MAIMKVKDIVDNLNLFKGCYYVHIKIDSYPYYISSDESKFYEHLNDEIKEIETCPQSYDGPGIVYVTI